MKEMLRYIENKCRGQNIFLTNFITRAKINISWNNHWEFSGKIKRHDLSDKSLWVLARANKNKISPAHTCKAVKWQNIKNKEHL